MQKKNPGTGRRKDIRENQSEIQEYVVLEVKGYECFGYRRHVDCWRKLNNIPAKLCYVDSQRQVE